MKRLVRVYPTLLRVGFAEAVAYRAELVIWLLTTTMPLVSLALWSAVAATGPVGRYGAGDFAAYFLAALVVRNLTGSWLVWQMNQEIRTGVLSQRLLRPLHPLLAYSAENLAAIPLRALLAAPVALVALAGAAEGRLATSPGMLAAFAVSLLGAWLINFTTMALIGSLAFFVDNSRALFELYLAAFMILSGYLVPLELFPGWLGDVAAALPFRYTLGMSVELLLGLVAPEHVLRELAVQWAYVAALLALALVAFRAGVRRFAAFGG